MINALKAAARRRLSAIKRYRQQERGDHLRLDRGTTVHYTTFEGYNQVGPDCTIVRSAFGLYTYAGPRCIIADATIGRFCSIAPEVMIGSGGHPVRANVALHPIFYLSRPELGWTLVGRDSHEEFAPTVVGSDVWIGARAIVRDGITIGHGAIVGAGSVVVKNVAPYGVYAGVPARLIRFRFTEPIIERLLAIRWWERDVAWLREHASDFADVAQFLPEVEQGA